MWLNNYKSAHKSFKTKKQGTQKPFRGNYINGRYTDGNLQMVLMSMKKLVYNKLERQMISCFINAISSLVVLTYCYHY